MELQGVNVIQSLWLGKGWLQGVNVIPLEAVKDHCKFQQHWTNADGGLQKEM